MDYNRASFMARGKTDEQLKTKKIPDTKKIDTESDAEDDKYKNFNASRNNHNPGDEDENENLSENEDENEDENENEEEWDDENDNPDADDGDGDAEEDEAVVDGDVGNIEDAAPNNDDDECAYNSNRKTGGIKKVSANIDRDDDDDDDDEIDLNINENAVNPNLYTKPEDRKSTPILTQYERVRLIGDRTAQLAQGAKPMIDGVNGMDPRVVSQLELESKMIPIKICRPMPNGMKEVWELKELKLKKKYIIYGFTGGAVDKDLVNQIDSEYKKGGSIIGYSQLAAKYNSNSKTIK
jgi:DNA-directed RNA polymerase subunit K/omega